MSNSVQFIFYTIGILLLIGSALGLKIAGERVALVGLGIAAIFFITWWNLLAVL